MGALLSVHRCKCSSVDQNIENEKFNPLTSGKKGKVFKQTRFVPMNGKPPVKG